MTDKVKSSPSNNLDFRDYDELVERVFTYTLAAHDFGFTHKMNNRFTSISMNLSFLKQALARGDYDKARSKTVQISDSIDKLIKFAQNLGKSDLMVGDAQEIEFPSILSGTVRTLLNLPTFRGINIKQVLDENMIRTHANSEVIQIFLFAYLKHAKRYKFEGPITLSSTWDNEHNQYIINTDVGKILSSPNPESDVTALDFPSLGEMPLRYLARVIRHVSDVFELNHRPDRPLSAELKLNVSDSK